MPWVEVKLGFIRIQMLFQAVKYKSVRMEGVTPWPKYISGHDDLKLVLRGGRIRVVNSELKQSTCFY